MNAGTTLVKRLQQLALRADDGEVRDGQLLDCYVQDGDQTAFEVLVRRHGPMVMGVCQRLLQSRADAEDAFQAVFLVLVRRARCIRPRDRVGNWLHGVAYRVALRARADVLRRRQREGDLPERMEAQQGERDDLFELRMIVDREINHLPDRYRLPIILCLLEGRSRRDAARQLGWTEGTLSGRLARARQLLKKRLERYVSLVSAGALAVFSAESVAEASPSSRFVAALALGALENEAARAGRIIQWQERTIKAMKMENSRRLVAYAAIVALAFCVFSVTVFRQTTAHSADVRKSQSSQIQPQAKAPVNQIKPLNRIFFIKNSRMFSVQTNGKGLQSLSKDKFFPHNPVWSPDGKIVAYGKRKTYAIPQAGQANPQDLLCDVYIKAAQEKGQGKKLPVKADYFHWTRDGKHLLLSAIDSGDLTSWIVNANTLRATPLDLPPRHVATDVTRDGRWYLTTHIPPRKNGQIGPATIWMVKRDKSKVKKLTAKTQAAFMGKFSPDDRRILCMALERIPKKIGKKPPQPSVYVMDLKGKLKRIAQELNADFQGFSWSPDGKQIAYIWRTLHADGKLIQPTDSFLMIVNADGSNSRTILSATGAQQYIITLCDVCWR